MASKDQIIAEASRLFVEKGFEKTTMEDIATALDIYKGSLYYHIRSKAALFYEILTLSLRESTKKLRKASRYKGTPEEKFRKVLETHFDNIFTFSPEYQIVVNERRHMLDKRQEKIIRSKMKAYENCIYDVIQEGIAAKVFLDDFNPRVIVNAIFGASNSLYKWFSFNGPLSFNEVTQMYIDFFIRSLKR